MGNTAGLQTAAADATCHTRVVNQYTQTRVSARLFLVRPLRVRTATTITTAQMTLRQPRAAVLVAVLSVLVLLCHAGPTVEWRDDAGHLNVFVVPHSHNDPGWWYPFDEYYARWTKHIISSVVETLNQVRRYSSSIDAMYRCRRC